MNIVVDELLAGFACGMSIHGFVYLAWCVHGMSYMASIDVCGINIY